MKKKICLIYTGGTIGGAIENCDDNVVADRTKANFNKLLTSTLPNWVERSWDIESPFRKLSEEIEPNDWAKLAKAIADAQDKNCYAGIVVAHGTDTMSYATAAISFMISPKIPIVFTGSNLPLEAPRTDAINNISHAIFLAQSFITPGVYVCFCGTPDGSSMILEGHNIRKDAWRNDVFQPAQGSPLGYIHPKKLFKKPLIEVRKATDISVYPEVNDFRVNPNVMYFQLFPGLNPQLIRMVTAQKFEAIVLGLYGVGTLCSTGAYSIVNALSELSRENVAIFLTSQNYSKLDLGSYISSKRIESIGCYKLEELSPSAAIVKAMTLMGKK